MVLSDPEDVENGIELSAVPGAGTGIISCGCRGQAESDSTIISPDGHTRIFNDTCYDIEPGPFGTVVVDGETRKSRKLVLHAKCTSCCTCDMYASIVNDKLAALATAVRSAKSDISSLLQTYESGVDAFNRRIYVPKLSDVTVTISGMPIGENLSPKLGGTGVKGKMGRCAFTAIVRNLSLPLCPYCNREREKRQAVFGIAGNSLTLICVRRIRRSAGLRRRPGTRPRRRAAPRPQCRSACWGPSSAGRLHRSGSEAADSAGRADSR